MNAFAPFPGRLHWTAQQLADAVPLRLWQLYAFDARPAGRATDAANRAVRRARRTAAYAAPSPLPSRFAVR
jgi:hypothetical protein